MSLNRREFLKTLFIVPAAASMPGAVVSAMMGPEGAGPRNLILLDLKGGVDGLNMVVPYNLQGGLYYSEYRPTLNVPANQVLDLDGSMGLHPMLSSLMPHWSAGRLAVMQGVGYPDPSFSHDTAADIWQTGDPDGMQPDGWLARHLQAMGSPPGAGPIAASIEGSPTTILAGAPGFVPTFEKLKNFVFPFDSQYFADGLNREAAFAAMAAGLGGSGGFLGNMAETGSGILDLIAQFQALPEFTHVGDWPEDSSPRKQLQLVMRLLAADSGLRYFHVPFGGFDSHADQELDGYFSNRMERVAMCLDALYTDLASVGLAQDTLVVVFSEFGRTMYENGSGGSDHGSVCPVLAFGDPVTGGFHTPHASIDPIDLSEDDSEMVMTTDFRDVFGTVVNRWLGGNASTIFTGHSVSEIDFL